MLMLVMMMITTNDDGGGGGDDGDDDDEVMLVMMMITTSDDDCGGGGDDGDDDYGRLIIPFISLFISYSLASHLIAIAIVTDSSTSSNAIEAGASRPARDNKDRKPIKAPTVSKGPKTSNKDDTTDNSINNNNSNSSSSSDAVVNKEVRRPSNKKAAAAPTDSTAVGTGTGTDPTDVKDGELNYEEPSLPRRSRQRKLPNAGQCTI